MKKSLVQAASILLMPLAVTLLSEPSAACQRSNQGNPQQFYLDFSSKSNQRLSGGMQQPLTITGCAGTPGSEMWLRIAAYSRLPWTNVESGSAFAGYAEEKSTSTSIVTIDSLPTLTASDVIPADNSNQCIVKSPFEISKDVTNYKNRIVLEKRSLSECFAYRIKNFSGLPVKLVSSPDCQVQNLSENEAIARGADCRVEQPRGNYEIQVELVQKCLTSESYKEMKTPDLDGRFFARLITQAGNEKSVDLLGTQAVRLKVTDAANTKLEMTEIRSTNPDLNFKTPSGYAVDYHFAKLQLSGVPEFGLKARLTNYIENRSTVDCSGAACVGYAQQRAPVTLRNQIFRAPKDSPNQRIALGDWVQNAVVQAQWSGLESFVEQEYSLTSGNTAAQLDEQETKKLEVGDYLIVVSDLENPNESFRELVAKVNRKAKATSTTRVQGARGGQTLEPLDTLGGFTLGDLPDLAMSIDRNDMKKRLDWPFEYQKYCSATDSGKCVSLWNNPKPLNRTVTLLRVKSLDTAVVTEVLKTQKTSQIANEYIKTINYGLEFHCK